MTGATITIKYDDSEVQAMFARIQRRLGDLKPAMKVIGQIVRTSVVRNFEQGGRPRWKPLSRVTLARRKGSKILYRQGMAGGLAGSIHDKAYRDRAVIGTNKIQAAVHQFGAKKGSFGEFTAHIKAHMRKMKGKKVQVGAHTRRVKLPWGDIPARPYLMVQNEDWTEIRAALGDYIVGR